MTPDESRTLALAQRVWHDAQPSDDEIELALHRLHEKAVRHRPRAARLRMGPAFAVAVALIAVLAYAAPGSRARISSFSKRVLGSAGIGAERAPVPTVRPSGMRQAAPPDPPLQRAAADDASATSSEVQRLAPEPASSDRAGADAAKERERAAAAHAHAKPRGATWQDVNRALAAGDDTGAANALRELERGAPDLSTRAKARLGLAQLAVGRGDCTAARKLARSVATTPNLDEKIVHRAHSVLLRCELR